VPVAATDPLYILYTSGTTGRPKGVVRDTGGYIVALKWSMRGLYGVEPGEVYWCASDVGWVVGHSYIVYGPLLHGCTTILYEGKPVGTPDAGAFWRVVSEHGPSRSSRRRPPFAPSRRRTRTGISSRGAICRSSARFFLPASAPTPTRCNGPKRSSACR
jgi:propionyl-CoA synthetase